MALRFKCVFHSVSQLHQSSLPIIFYKCLIIARCEQQYRLHRLLAFDPTNECRGIFSDWFRFPSFCICKCYNSARQFKEVNISTKLPKIL